MRQNLNKILVILIVCSCCLWLLGINEPFVGSYGANQNYFTLAAKNFQRFGYLRLKFLPTYYAGGDLSVTPDPYLHHPVFYFSLVSIPYLFFGFNNWTASVIPLFFSFLTVFWLYQIGKFFFNKTGGLISALLTAVFPIMTVYSHQTIFEPAILSLLSGTYYFFLKYLKDKKINHLLLLGILSFSAILFDWGGAYYILPFLLLYAFFPNKSEKNKAMVVYFSVIISGIAIFLLQVYLFKGSFHDLIFAISSRKDNPELFGLSYPWLRLLLTTLFRIVIYFSPFIILSLIIFGKNLIRVIKTKNLSLLVLSQIFFLIFALQNLFVLPAATFGHIYFLLYFVPFFALVSTQFILESLKKHTRLTIILLFILVIYSAFITDLKWQQITKQVWRYQAATKFNSHLNPYEEIGIYGFPGDVFEQYFYHPTIPLENYDQVLISLSREDQLRKVVFSCWGNCSEEDLEFINQIPYEKIQYGQSWLIINREVEKIRPAIKMNNAKIIKENQGILKFYRKLTNFLQVGQL